MHYARRRRIIRLAARGGTRAETREKKIDGDRRRVSRRKGERDREGKGGKYASSREEENGKEITNPPGEIQSRNIERRMSAWMGIGSRLAAGSIA